MSTRTSKKVDLNDRSRHRTFSIKKGILKDFAKLKRKKETPAQSDFL